MEKKKLLTFGIMGLFAFALVSGAIVSYLSNTVEAEVTVKSPMEQWISDGSGWTQSTILFDVYGGEKVNLWVKTQNHANAPITGEGKNIVTNPSGVTCADFDLVQARTDSGSGYGSFSPVTCVDVYNGKVEFAYGPNPNTWVAGQVDKTEIETTFNQYAKGDYEFTSQII